jgi:hypothetical protein
MIFTNITKAGNNFDMAWFDLPCVIIPGTRREFNKNDQSMRWRLDKNAFMVLGVSKVVIAA